jgi:type II secretory pathway component PulK
MLISSRQTPTPRRRGYVLIAVLLVIVVLSLAAYRFADAMGAEYQAAIRATEAAQARAYAVSGIHYAMAALADPVTFYDMLGGYPYDNPAAFANIPVGLELTRGGGRFSIVSVGDAGFGEFAVRYGVEDESGKININALIRLDPGGTVLSTVLSQLPGMTQDLVDAIVDWVDSDDEPRPAGAEAESYPFYQPKNGPLNSLDELLLVRGITPEILYGSDRNRNGQLDPDEAAVGPFYRGLADYITVYGRELNVDSTGAPRIFLNESDLALLNEQLAAAVGQDMADYVVAYRMYTTGRATSSITPSSGGSSGGSGGGGGGSGSSGGGGGNNSRPRVTGGPEELRAAVAQSLQTSATARRRIRNSILSLRGTQVTLPRPPDAQQDDPDIIVPCPLNNQDYFIQALPVLLDRTTARSAYELNPRLNVNTAPADVLIAAGAVAGVSAEDINSALAIRNSLIPGSPETTTGAWLVTQAGMRPEIFQELERLITGTTQTYRVQSLGYFAQGGPMARVEAVIDTNQGAPRIVYFRDLTDLGPGFVPPR